MRRMVQSESLMAKTRRIRSAGEAEVRNDTQVAKAGMSRVLQFCIERNISLSSEDVAAVPDLVAEVYGAVLAAQAISEHRKERLMSLVTKISLRE